MAKVYSAPDTPKKPELNFSKFKEYQPAWDKYIEELKAWCIKRNPQENVGEIISFPVADGSAMYMVAAMKPVELIHLDYLDGYQFQYDYLLTAKEVKEKIKQDKAFAKIWANAKQAKAK